MSKDNTAQPEPTPQDVDASEVKDFLNSDSTTADVVFDEETSAELRDALSASESAAQPADEEDRIETAADPTYNPNLPAKDEILEWAFGFATPEAVNLTEKEKADFLRAALVGEPLVFAITILNNIEVLCRGISDYETSLLYKAINLDKEDGLIEADADFYDRMQLYGRALQVVSIDGKSQHCLHFEDALSVIDLAERFEADVDKLRTRGCELQVSVQAPQVALTKNVLRIFSAKMKLAMDNMANADFWKPADVG